MALNRKIFYDKLRELKVFSHLLPTQVQGMEAVLNHWESTGLTDLRWLAYMFATMTIETGNTMQPIEEWGKGKGRPYGQKLKRSGVAYTVPDKLYYGRSDIQLTWYENYELMGRLLSIDLLNHPEKALEMDVAIKIMFEGMTKGASSFGDFTGKCLEMYFNDRVEDWIGARRIINGQDRAEEIGNSAKIIYACLKAAA